MNDLDRKIADNRLVKKEARDVAHKKLMNEAMEMSFFVMQVHGGDGVLVVNSVRRSSSASIGGGGRVVRARPVPGTRISLIRGMDKSGLTDGSAVTLMVVKDGVYSYDSTSDGRVSVPAYRCVKMK